MHTLFQYLNRTSTYVGKKRLAFLVSNRLSNQEINSNQEAVKELTPESSWRIEFQARARIIGDKEDKYQSIINWSKTENVTPSIFSRTVLYLFPVLFALCFFSFIFTHTFLSLRLSAFVFVMNLGVLGFYFKRISAELLAFDKIKRTLEQYALLIQSIETKKFQSESLRKLQEELTHNEKSAGQSIKELASIIQNLDSVQNLVGASVFNGTVLFHVHCFFKLLKWKRAHAKEVEQWFEVLGKVEALNSLANFKFNNPAFCFPEISETEQLRFEEMGHPLISESKRICNDVSFDEQRFIVLTGSNMSGKSTFLRTIGINMVLANCGAPVCAKSAVLNPRDIHVAMRVDDSLADIQSYFFAEINRLKSLVESNNSKDSFIILDEILRGTNSDDKRNGTIKLLEKLHLMNSCGIIATHDLEVCKISDEHPSFFSNKCFEVEITNNELVFDYQLRAGICQNKSATFLMEKAGII
jgi:DNA mismatch repair ATPase MutS